MKPTNQQTQNPAAKSDSKALAWLKTFIPGIIIAAVVFGPSKMTITSKLGSEYGYSLLWIVVVAIFFMIIFTGMGSRIGSASKTSLLQLIQQKLGKNVSILVGFGVFLVTTSFQAGNSIGVGISIGEATGTSPKLWIVVFNLIGIALLFFRSFYKTLETVMLALVGLMLLAFVTTLFLVQPGIGDIISGFSPGIPTGSEGLVIAFMASCFSIVGAFYQAYLVRERAKLNEGSAQTGADKSVTGILILGLLSMIVMICAAVILHPQGIKVSNAMDMAKALEPLFGGYAAVLFLAGLFGASFSSLIGNASIGGTLLGDALGYGSQLSSKMVRIFIALVMIFGAIIAIIFGRLPLELIVLAQSVTIFLVPFIGIAMYIIANDEAIMGKLKNRPWQKLFGALGLLLTIGLAISNVYDLFIK
jgi:Mn2+/Fe2+ NRAMP family transporter